MADSDVSVPGEAMSNPLPRHGPVPIEHEASHQWAMTGIWYISEDQIRDSEESQEPMKLGEPDEIGGPGCVVCGEHWYEAKDVPCPGET